MRLRAVCPRYVQMEIRIPPKYAVSQVMGYINGKSAIWIARTSGGRKRHFVGEHLRARGYYVSTVGTDEAVIRADIERQEHEDKRLDQLSFEQESLLGRLRSN
jgi:putative transposase